MNDIQVNCFMEIVRQNLNFSKAADHLFITQPALSRQIAKLESEYKVLLFDTSNKKKVILTPAGKILFDFFDETTRKFEQVLLDAKKANSSFSVTLKIACVEGWSVTDLMNKIDVFKRKCPHTSVFVTAFSFEEIMSGIYNGDYDIGITEYHMVKDLKKDICFQEIEESSFIFLYSANNRRLAEKDPLLAMDFKEEPLYLLPRSKARIANDLGIEFCRKLGFSPMIENMPNFDSIFMAIEGGHGFTIVDRRVYMTEYPSFRSFPIGIYSKNGAIWSVNCCNTAVLQFVDELIPIP